MRGTLTFSSSEPVGYPWGLSLLLVSPAVALCVLGGAIGIDQSLGLALCVAGLALLILVIGVALVKLENAVLKPGPRARAIDSFVRSGGVSRRIDDVVDSLQEAVEQAFPGGRAILVAPGPVGGVNIISNNPGDLSQDVGDPVEAFIFLGDSNEPLARRDLRQLVHLDGASATLALMDQLDVDVLLPLRHRGLLLALGLFSVPGEADLDFFRMLRPYVTAAVANTFLELEASGGQTAETTLDLANAVQEALMPQERPVLHPNYELRGLFIPVADCGGDLWSWRELGDDSILLVIADATGHGAGPALVSAVAKGAIDAYAQLHGPATDPAELLAALNRAVYRVGRRRLMMTAFAAIVDMRQRSLRISNAAHNFPLVVGPDKIEPLVVRGDSLGAAENARFVTESRPFSPGERLFLFTDGVVEAGAPEIEAYGERRLRRLLSTLAAGGAANMPGGVLDAVLQHLGDTQQSDDISMLAFEYGQVGVEL